MTDVVWTTLYQMKEAQPARYAALAIRFEWSVLYLHQSVGKCSCHSSKALGFDRDATQPLQTHDLTVEDRNLDEEDSDSYGPSDFVVIMQNFTQSSDPTTSSYETPSGEEGAPQLNGDEKHGTSLILVQPILTNTSKVTTGYRGQLKRRYRMVGRPSYTHLLHTNITFLSLRYRT